MAQEIDRPVGLCFLILPCCVRAACQAMDEDDIDERLGITSWGSGDDFQPVFEFIMERLFLRVTVFGLPGLRIAQIVWRSFGGILL
jgi:hypothetical protein